MAAAKNSRSEVIVVGSIVKLSSGGSQMTATKVNEDGRVNVAWLDKDNRLQEALLPSAALVVVVAG